MSHTSALRFAFLPLGLLAAQAATDDAARISGPYTHENLSIYLIHGAAGAPRKALLTLQEALDQKKAVVYETGNVNELSIENRSAQDVYIQSGDIVKGGRQDRVLTTDFILPAHSGKLPIAAFCVEHGRWTKRGEESAERFEASNMAVSGKELKMAVRVQASQAEVWNQVAGVQTKLRAGTASPLPSPSPSSMQLALESKPVVAATDTYVKALANIVEKEKDVVGYAYAINGTIDSAEVYASADLFRRMWPKLLQSSATEAVAARPKAKDAAPPDIAAVSKSLKDAERGRSTTQSVTARERVVKTESDKLLLFETRDDSGWIHKSYVVK